MEGEEGIAGENVERSVVCGNERFYVGGRQGIRNLIVTKTACMVLEKAVCCADPQIAVGGLRESGGVVGREGGRVCLVEDFEVDPVESCYASFRGYPDVAVAGLEDLVNAVLRETILGGPVLVAERAEVLRPGTRR